MRVELRVYLKIASGKTIPAGTVFDTRLRPLPEYILNRIFRRQAIVLEATPGELAHFGIPASLTTAVSQPGSVLLRGKRRSANAVKPQVKAAEVPPPASVPPEQEEGAFSSFGENTSAADPDLVASITGETTKMEEESPPPKKSKFVKKKKTEK